MAETDCIKQQNSICGWIDQGIQMEKEVVYVELHDLDQVLSFFKPYLDRAFPAAPAGTVVVSTQGLSDLREKVKALRQKIGNFEA